MTGNSDHFDENLKRMLEAALDQPRPAFQERLVRDVLVEVARQRQLEQSGERAEGGVEGGFMASLRRLLHPGVVAPWRNPLLLTGAAGAAVLITAGLWLATGTAGSTIGRVKLLYGVVAVQNDGVAETLTAATDLKPGQHVQTRTGSKAEILLPDKSRLISAPRTTLQVARSRQGSRILLEEGAFSLEAAKQPPGKAIRIQASGARIKVLGTRLYVRLVEKPSGTRQTRVRVLSGQVKMESGGQTVLLLPGTEGVADTDQPPSRSSVVFEVNELIGLWNQTRALAANSGRRYGLPAILDLTTETFWSLVPTQRLQPAGPKAFTLKLKYPAFRSAAFTLDGAEIPAAGSGQILRLDFSTLPSPQLPEYLILKVPGVGGLIRETEAGLNECALPGPETDLPALLEFHLPESARLEQVTPGAMGTRQERNRLIVTVAASVRLPQVCE
jgi:hypothetical protein